MTSCMRFFSTVLVGCDINLGDKYRRTPLLVASRDGKIDLVKLLLAGGAQVNKTDTRNRTPLLGKHEFCC